MLILLVLKNIVIFRYRLILCQGHSCIVLSGIPSFFILVVCLFVWLLLLLSSQAPLARARCVSGAVCNGPHVSRLPPPVPAHHVFLRGDAVRPGTQPDLVARGADTNSGLRRTDTRRFKPWKKSERRRHKPESIPGTCGKQQHKRNPGTRWNTS